MAQAKTKPIDGSWNLIGVGGGRKLGRKVAGANSDVTEAVCSFVIGRLGYFAVNRRYRKGS